jgi:glycogen debranching enzyme
MLPDDGLMKASGPPAGITAPLPAAAVQFYIPASSSLQERQPRTLKHGDTFGLFDHYGDIVPGEGSPEGLYHEDTRFLSGLQLLINERRPLLLSSTVQDNNALLTADLTNPDFFVDGRLVLRRNTIHIVRARFIWQAAACERLAIRNFDARQHRVLLSFAFQSDFVDLFEVRGHRRARRGETAVEICPPHAVVFSYRGLDDERHLVALEFVPAPDRLVVDHAAFDLRLEPGHRISLFLTVKCDERPEHAPRPERFFVGLRCARRALRTSASRAAAVATSNEIFNEILSRSVADLAMLLTETAHGPFPYAGIPWFSTAFGRDGIITAMQLLWLDPTIARGVLRLLAARQATGFSAEADAEPGKILHETRRGEMARLGEIPFGLYYGSVDSTPLFVMLAGLYFKRSGDLETIRALWPNLEAALAWIDEYGDCDRDGLVEYQARPGRGLSNQGWKDSEDSIFHADGHLAEGAIALAEVQGYVYAAKRAAADLALALGDQYRSAELDAQAERLRQTFEAAFWCADLGTYALALDGDKQPCRVRASNAGQVLLSGIAAPDRAAQVADLLLEPTFFSGWGIRTLAASEARYNPMSYHNGSVWPHDNALIARGFARYGLSVPTLRVFSGLFEAAAYMDLRRLPELFCGFRRLPGSGPTFYPVACSPQAWASATPFVLLEACLRLEFDPTLQEIRFRQPRLPEFLDEVTIRKLTLGDSRFDIMLRRYGNEVSLNLLDRQGDGRVAVTL